MQTLAPRLLAALLLAATLVVNSLANTLPLGGRTTGEISGLFPNLLVPVGLTFSIWGVIYLLLVGWAVVQFLPGGRALGTRLAGPFALSSALNAGWLLAWHHLRIPLSMGVMLGLLAVLLVLNHRLAQGRGEGGAGWADHLARAGFGVYLGWILVATLVNATVVLVDAGWDGRPLPPEGWAPAILVVGAAVALFVLARLRNPWVAPAVAWGYLGIALNRWEDQRALALLALLLAGAVLLSMLGSLLSGRFGPPPGEARGRTGPAEPGGAS